MTTAAHDGKLHVRIVKKKHIDIAPKRFGRMLRNLTCIYDLTTTDHTRSERWVILEVRKPFSYLRNGLVGKFKIDAKLGRGIFQPSHCWGTWWELTSVTKLVLYLGVRAQKLGWEWTIKNDEVCKRQILVHIFSFVGSLATISNILFLFYF